MGCAIGCGEGRGIQAPARSRFARRACDDLRLQHPNRQHFSSQAHTVRSCRTADSYSPANLDIRSAVCNVCLTSTPVKRIEF
jgi:hypothetical protein